MDYSLCPSTASSPAPKWRERTRTFLVCQFEIIAQVFLEYWSFSFSISPSNDYSGMIFFRMDWLDLPAIQGTLKSLLQHHNSKASILWRSAFFIVQLSHPYMTTGKTTALTRQTLVGKVMSLLFNMLCSLDIDFLPRSKHLLTSWLHWPSPVILEPPKIKSLTISIVSPSVLNNQWNNIPKSRRCMKKVSHGAGKLCGG